MQLSAEFAKTLRARRKELNLNQKELAELAGVGKSTISDLETSRTKTCNFLPDLAHALEMSIGELIGVEYSEEADLTAIKREVRHLETMLKEAMKTIQKVKSRLGD